MSGPLEALRRRLERALAPDPQARPREGWVPGPSVVPAGGRRAQALLSCGVWPYNWVAPIPGRSDEPNGAVVYLDTSGSMWDYLPGVCGLLLALRRLLVEPLSAFSTRVAPLTLAALQRGQLPSDGGTEFGCVLEDAVRRRARRVLVITDGMGPLPAPAAARAREAGLEVHVVLLPGILPAYTPWSAVARTVEVLPV